MIPGLQPFATAAMLGGGLGDMKQRYDSGMYSMGTNDPTTGQTNFDWAGNAKRFGWDAAKTGLDVALSAAGYKLPAGQAPIGALERGMGYAAAPMNFLTSLPGKAIGLGKTYVPQAYNAAVSGAGRLATSIGESTGGQLIGKGMNALGQTAVGRGFSTLGRGLGYTAGAAGNVARGAANVAGQGFNALGRGVSHLGSQEFAAAYPRLGPALQWTGNTLIAKPAAQLRNATNFGTNLAVGGRKFLTKMLPEEYGVAVDMMPDVYKNFGQGTEGLLNVGEALVEDRSKSYLKGKAKEFNKYVGQQGQAARGEGDKNMYSNFRMYRNPNGSYSGFPYAMNDIRNAFRTGSRQFASGFAPSNSQWKVE
jgi:hypothetical protein